MEPTPDSVLSKCLENPSYFAAIATLIGVFAGSSLTIMGNFFLHWLQERPRRKLEKKQKRMLMKLLDDERFADQWRKLSTLSSVIGSDNETTKRLLIEIKARGSESDDDLWGFIKHHPLDQTLT